MSGQLGKKPKLLGIFSHLSHETLEGLDGIRLLDDELCQEAASMQNQ